jgi:hypothetical protein
MSFSTSSFHLTVTCVYSTIIYVSLYHHVSQTVACKRRMIG